MAVASGGGRESRLRKKGGDEKLESAGMMRWLLTYADMITLLLALFIILFSISTVSQVKFQALVHDVSGGFNNDWAINNPPNGGTTGDQSGHSGEADLQKIQQKIKAYIKDNKLQSNVETRIDRRGLVISILTDRAQYDSGSAQLKPAIERLLDQLKAPLAKTHNDIRVEGNTDNVPIATSTYPSNWELSAARATGAVRYLVDRDGVPPTRISLAGYGEFRPSHPNDSEVDRQLNRRVDIVILNAKSTAAEQSTQP
ncbi:MAG: OmpA family protein [Candidatus Velthaea sp.]